MKILYLTLLSCFSIGVGYGQTSITIQGNIKNAQGENIPQALITLKQVADSSLLSYTYSNSQGNYELSYSGEEENLLLVVSGLGIATQTRKIANRSQSVNFTVQEEDFLLKEVEIKAPKIYYNKDTISYSVEAFSDATDVAIGDVLKKMPGIDVAESGEISYQGKAINKFYVENMDLLNGRYGIATQNISAKDVSTVQVMENHQPIRAMDSLRISDRAAINLKLKESAKGSWSVMAQAGLGLSPLLWDNELTAMYFARKHQNISTYKTNNAGLDLSKELRSFNTSLELPSGTITFIQAPSPPDIRPNRYLFNNSHAATINNLFAIGNKKELNFNLIYFNDYEKRESEAVSTYFITGDSLLQIDEAIRSATNTHRLETEIRYNENLESRYLNNLLNLEGSWETANGHILNGEPIDQRLDRPSFKLQNAFHWIERLGDKGFELYSQTGLQTTPQQLSVSPGMNTGLFDDELNVATLQQDARNNTFVTQNEISLLRLLVWGNVVMRPMFSVNLAINNLTSELHPENGTFAAATDSMKNDLRRNHYQARMKINVDYKTGHFKLNAGLPFSYNRYELNNKLRRENSENQNRFEFDPSLDMQYVFSRKMDINAQAALFHSMNSLYEMYDGYLLQTYRYLNHYDSRLALSSGYSLSAKFNYKNILKMLFASASITRSGSKENYIYTQRFENNLLVSSLTEQANESNRLIASGKISKGFDWMRLTTDLSVVYFTRTSQQIRQERLTDYRSDQYSASVRLSAVPASFLVVSYLGTGQESVSTIQTEAPFEPIRSWNQSLGLDFKLFNTIRLGGQIEQYANSAIENNQIRYFVDLNMNYVWKQIHFTLDCTNLLNTRKYVMAYHDNLNAFYSGYRIRPAEVVLKVRLKIK
ncbi:MAG: hypothetical protein LBB85_02895 [Dysgonamonadaceae bacterium]|jgi:hypothetical protein|nr:hypothetical protein [Dysgonamonadaceae bacterium]